MIVLKSIFFNFGLKMFFFVTIFMWSSRLKKNVFYEIHLRKLFYIFK
jgi:hypothetical protein